MECLKRLSDSLNLVIRPKAVSKRVLYFTAVCFRWHTRGRLLIIEARPALIVLDRTEQAALGNTVVIRTYCTRRQGARGEPLSFSGVLWRLVHSRRRQQRL